jgi:tRNA-specific 2-thiouridylase
VLNEKGEVIGHHEGVFFYTLGERRGFVIAKKTSSDKPYFIIAKDLKNNTLTVSSNPRQKNKAKNTIVLEDTNWLIKPAINKNYTCQYRYRGKYLDCKLENNDDKWTIILSKAESDIAPGQSIVVYDGDTCLGGGVIK